MTMTVAGLGRLDSSSAKAALTFIQTPYLEY
jgi:hypothetical protein